VQSVLVNAPLDRAAAGPAVVQLSGRAVCCWATLASRRCSTSEPVELSVILLESLNPFASRVKPERRD
jgi:hypothetical protein